MILDRKIQIPATHWFITPSEVRYGREIIYRTGFRYVYFDVSAGRLQVRGEAVIEKLVRIFRKRLPLLPEEFQYLTIWSYSTGRHAFLLEQRGARGPCENPYNHYQERLIKEALHKSVALNPNLLRETFLGAERELAKIGKEVAGKLFGELRAVGSEKVA